MQKVNDFLKCTIIWLIEFPKTHFFINVICCCQDGLYYCIIMYRIIDMILE